MATIEATSFISGILISTNTKHRQTNGAFNLQPFRSKSAPNYKRIRAMASAPRRETDPKKRVVITGMGLVSALGSDVDIFYNKLLEGESSIAFIDRFDTSYLPVKIAAQIRDFNSTGYIDKKLDQRLDDCWRYCIVAGKKALDHANLGKEVLQSMDRRRIGVLIGSSLGGLKTFRSGVESMILNRDEKINPFFLPYTAVSIGPALLAIDTGLMGPNYSISTACSTASTCIYVAANHIKMGDADIMVVGGTDAPITPTGIRGLLACGILSKSNKEPQKTYRPWDIDRDGTVLGEGSGILIMESLEHAMKRGAKVYAEYLGGAATCDAFHLTNPSPEGIAMCMTRSLEASGVLPEEVNYVNPHGTSTYSRDIAEVSAIKNVFQDTSEMKMNATKSWIGHAMGAGGAFEAIATIKAINTGWLHPTANQYNLDPAVTIDTVPNVKKQHEVNVALSFNRGFGGQNAALVFAPFFS